MTATRPSDPHAQVSTAVGLAVDDVGQVRPARAGINRPFGACGVERPCPTRTRRYQPVAGGSTILRWSSDPHAQVSTAPGPQQPRRQPVRPARAGINRVTPWARSTTRGPTRTRRYQPTGEVVSRRREVSDPHAQVSTGNGRDPQRQMLVRPARAGINRRRSPSVRPAPGPTRTRRYQPLDWIAWDRPPLSDPHAQVSTAPGRRGRRTTGVRPARAGINRRRSGPPRSRSCPTRTRRYQPHSAGS